MSVFEIENIPLELRQKFNWVMWRYEERNGKKTKVPYLDLGVKAQSNSGSWKTFEGALWLASENGFDGIGFMFGKDDDYIGIDIDHCIENGVINEFAQNIIDSLDSWTEISPSGTGIHIVIKGSLPDKIQGSGRKNAKHGLEIYRHSRFFTVTSNLECNLEIFERSDELEEIIDTYFDDSDLKGKADLSLYSEDKLNFSNEQLWEAMFESKKGQDIKELYSGKLINNDHSSSDLALCNYLAFWTGNSATRMDSMFRESALIRDKWDRIHFGDTGETYGERTIAMAISSTTSTILDNQNNKQLEQANFTIHTKVPEPSGREFNLTDVGNAERVADMYGNRIRNVHSNWFTWDGKRWKSGGENDVRNLITDCFRKLAIECIGDEDKKHILKHALKCEGASARDNMMKEMKPKLAAEMSDFDSNKYLLNLENGVLDLKTGVLKPHNMSFMMTKLSDVRYDKNATCPNWLNYLKTTIRDDNGETDYELIDYLQKLVGYSLTGDTTEQGIYFLFGDGRNGKSVFINMIQKLLGEYSANAETSSFVKTNSSGGANSDIARLCGSRFVASSEIEDGKSLDEQLVKKITGCEPITARFMYKDFFDFIPEFKIVFATNYKPNIKGGDNGIWRRVKLIPFTYVIPKEDVDYYLEDKLSLEMSGILNWALEGCIKWQKERLIEPKRVKDATNSYKEESDPILPFIDEMCFSDNSVKTTAKKIFEEYKTWCYRNDEEALGKQTFYNKLNSKGFIKRKGPGNKDFIFGLTLNTEKPYSISPQSNNTNQKVIKLN
ncbi:phage/plasmid primase, P4 family [Bacillus toyonensis]|uniref:phage/plasmid primase, P4 family n=1 Tax=Bacillus toyonensis TaxID=155322 RepID=UPI00027BEAAB|nr:phage/plasmid primase, P4 family [Bacillus toyonensis]EJV41779.1 phage/plasmid primase, P4 family domain-containing protein [Bacillus toyonensis]